MHPNETKTAALCKIARVVFPFKPQTVILDNEDNVIVPLVEQYIYVPSLSVFQNIIQSFLNYSVQVGFDVFVEEYLIYGIGRRGVKFRSNPVLA